VSPHDLLHELRCRDIIIEVDGPNLILDGPVDELNDALVDRLRAAKSELLDTLAGEASPSAWNHDDWQAHYEERTAIREYDGGFSSIEAQLLAYDDTVQHWLCLHPPPVHARQTCVHCGQPEGPTNALLSLLASGQHGSVHEQCWELWSGRRRAQAEEVLRRCGIDPTSRPPTCNRDLGLIGFNRV
jgi:hypothetical protein